MNTEPVTDVEGEEMSILPRRHISNAKKIVMGICSTARAAPIGSMGILIFAMGIYQDWPPIMLMAQFFVSVNLIVMPLDTKGKILKIIQERGCSEENVGWSTTHWCDRQMGLAVAEKLGKLDEYNALIRNNINRKFPWLPNF